MATREKILDVAYRAFAEKGYNRVSMGDIAKEIGVTRPALYYHFPSKESLLLAVYETIDPLTHVDTKKILACTDEDEYRREFVALLSSIIGNLRDDEQRARFVATVEVASAQAPSVLESAQAQYDAMCSAFLAAIEHGKEIGVISPDLDSDAAKRFLSIFVYGTGEVMLRGCKVDAKSMWGLVIAGLFE